MSKILITGGAGYLGSVMVPMMLDRGHKVTVLDSFLYGQNTLLDHCWRSNLTVVRGDARDEQLVAKLMTGKDIIIPLACIVGMPACDKRPIEARQVNLESVRFVVDSRTKGQKVIFPSTDSGYGSTAGGGHCDEKTPQRPISLYGRLKTEAEQYVLMGFDTVTLRLGTVFGMSPRMRTDLLINDFVIRALTDRSLTLFEWKFKRNFVHIRDVVSAFLFTIKNFDKMKGEPYNVGLDGALTKLEICEEIKEIIPDFWYTLYTGKYARTDKDKRDYIVSHEKMRQAGWEAKISVREGVEEIIKGMQILKTNQFSNV